MVTRLTSGRNRSSLAPTTSFWRPTKLVRCTGTFFGPGPHLPVRLFRARAFYRGVISARVSIEGLRICLTHICDEAISPASDGLHEARLLRIVLQDTTNFADSSVNAVISVNKSIPAPDPFNDLLAGDKLPFRFDQEEQQFRGNSFQFEDPARATQFVGAQVQREVPTELNRF